MDGSLYDLKAADAPSQRYHHGDLRVALISHGLDLLEADGLSGLTLRALAARVGVSHTAPKNHFASQDHLRAALAAEGFWRLAAALRQAAGPVPGPGVARRALDAATKAQRIRDISKAYLAFATSHKGVFQLMFAPLLREVEAPELPEAAKAAFTVLQEACEGLRWPAGRRAIPEKPDMAWMIWSMLHGHAQLSLNGFADTEPEAKLAAILPPLRFEETLSEENAESCERHG